MSACYECNAWKDVALFKTTFLNFVLWDYIFCACVGVYVCAFLIGYHAGKTRTIDPNLLVTETAFILLCDK